VRDLSDYADGIKQMSSNSSEKAKIQQIACHLICAPFLNLLARATADFSDMDFLIEIREAKGEEKKNTAPPTEPWQGMGYSGCLSCGRLP
jgi:hypothetical protein